MPRKYATEYIDRLLAEATYENLTALSAAICSSAQFTAASPDYGLPQFAFLFAETLLWFAQAARSGVWTYYEAASPARQDAMLIALPQAAPHEFALWYERGMHDWRDETGIAAVDDWIEANDEAAHEWLRALVRQNGETLLELTAQ
jgi:hypothetical protein